MLGRRWCGIFQAVTFEILFMHSARHYTSVLITDGGFKGSIPFHSLDKVELDASLRNAVDFAVHGNVVVLFFLVIFYFNETVVLVPSSKTSVNDSGVNGLPLANLFVC